MNYVKHTGCKINIGLNIVEKRSDGYHNLQTIFYPIPLKDELELTESNEDGLEICGIEIAGDVHDNLILRTVRLLRAEGHQIPPVHFRLQKNIPSGAGLGGGSSDAACTMKMLNEAFLLGLTPTQMETLIAPLGADCPFFIREKPVYAEGIGNLFTPIDLDLQGSWLVLVKPADFVSTKEAYSMVKPQFPHIPLLKAIYAPKSEWEEQIQNDFEKSVFPQHPTIRNIKEQLYQSGAWYAAMSGSGSSVFGLFRNPTHLRETFAGHFYFECQL